LTTSRSAPAKYSINSIFGKVARRWLLRAAVAAQFRARVEVGRRRHRGSDVADGLVVGGDARLYGASAAAERAQQIHARLGIGERV
jgi:hypothetical protein